MGPLNWVNLLLVLIAVGFRLNQLLMNRTLWWDEAALAVNVLHRPIAGLFQALDFNQAAPIGFLLVQKAMVGALGNTEVAFRLVPFAAQLASLAFLWKIGRRILPPAAVSVALGLSAVSGPLIRYSAEAKPYSTDVLVSLILVWIALPLLQGQWDNRRILALTITGTLSFWFSYPAVFTVAAICTALTWEIFSHRQAQGVRWLVLILVLGATSFLLDYFISLKSTAVNPVLVDYWKAGFLHLPSKNLDELDRYLSEVLAAFGDPGGLRFVGLSAFLFLVGITIFFGKSPALGVAVLLPYALTLAASSLDKYPFAGRLILFLTPLMYLLIAQGVETIRQQGAGLGPPISVGLLVLLFFPPAVSALLDAQNPQHRDEMRLSMVPALAKRQPGDIIYVYRGVEPTFLYYAERYSVPGEAYVIGRSPVDTTELTELTKGFKRVWTVFGRISDEQLARLVGFFEPRWPRVETFSSDDAFFYAYDIQPVQGPPNVDPSRTTVPNGVRFASWNHISPAEDFRCEEDTWCEAFPLSVTRENESGFSSPNEKGARLIGFNGRVLYQRIRAVKGRVGVKLSADGSFGGGRYPVIHVVFFEENGEELGRQTIQLDRAKEESSIEFHVPQDQSLTPALVFDDDFYAALKGDRNVAVYSFKMRISR